MEYECWTLVGMRPSWQHPIVCGMILKSLLWGRPLTLDIDAGVWLPCYYLRLKEEWGVQNLIVNLSLLHYLSRESTILRDIIYYLIFFHAAYAVMCQRQTSSPANNLTRWIVFAAPRWTNLGKIRSENVHYFDGRGLYCSDHPNGSLLWNSC